MTVFTKKHIWKPNNNITVITIPHLIGHTTDWPSLIDLHNTANSCDEQLWPQFCDTKQSRRKQTPQAITMTLTVRKQQDAL